MTVEVQPYFAEGERYPALIGVRAEGDEYETAYVNKSELVDALAENAKLRELVRNYHSAMCCMLDTGIWPTDPKWLERRMRELGIEVR